jgi:hypothetical protein
LSSLGYIQGKKVERETKEPPEMESGTKWNAA